MRFLIVGLDLACRTTLYKLMHGVNVTTPTPLLSTEEEEEEEMLLILKRIADYPMRNFIQKRSNHPKKKEVEEKRQSLLSLEEEEEEEEERNRPMFYTIWKRKLAVDFSPFPYLIPYTVKLFNCIWWVVFWVLAPNSLWVIAINSAGVVMEMLYISTYVACSRRNEKITALKILGAEFMVVSLITTVVLNLEQRLLVAEILSGLFGILMYATPLFVLRISIAKNVWPLPFSLSLSLAIFTNGVCWTADAVIRMQILSGMGAVFGALQLIIYVIYYISVYAPDRDSLVCYIGLIIKMGKDISAHGIWRDIDGLNKIPLFWRLCFQNADGLIYVVDGVLTTNQEYVAAKNQLRSIIEVISKLVSHLFFLT
ncbi:bidirectional sugar transporter SWEET5-like [Tasmannia lanceolata]|uniref:bidirectional sugar transporter SWEET5-like n=1 Tax=Tasmannia lanceolata TaxID=3420 RepID=UPI00406289A5